MKTKRGFARYTAVIGALAMDNTLIQRAAIETEFRTAADLFDRIDGGAGPGGVKAVAPTGVERIRLDDSRGRERGQPARRKSRPSIASTAAPPTARLDGRLPSSAT